MGVGNKDSKKRGAEGERGEMIGRALKRAMASIIQFVIVSIAPNTHACTRTHTPSILSNIKRNPL